MRSYGTKTSAVGTTRSYVLGNNGVDQLLVGRYRDGDLLFVENVDDGFIPATRQQVFKALQKLKTDTCPFANLPEKRGGFDREKMAEARWVKPKLVLEIAMNEWTPDRHLRHGEFKTLRPELKPQEVSPYPEKKSSLV